MRKLVYSVATTDDGFKPFAVEGTNLKKLWKQGCEFVSQWKSERLLDVWVDDTYFIGTFAPSENYEDIRRIVDMEVGHDYDYC